MFFHLPVMFDFYCTGPNWVMCLSTAQLCRSSSCIMNNCPQYNTHNNGVSKVFPVDWLHWLIWVCWNRDIEQKHSRAVLINGILGSSSVDVGLEFEDTTNPSQVHVNTHSEASVRAPCNLQQAEAHNISFLSTWHIAACTLMYNRLVKPLPIMLGKAPNETVMER